MSRDRPASASSRTRAGARDNHRPSEPPGVLTEPSASLDHPAHPDQAKRTGRGPGSQFSRPTPREMTRTDKTIAETDSAPINSLARCDNGMVSVGLNADEFVTDTYK